MLDNNKLDIERWCAGSGSDNFSHRMYLLNDFNRVNDNNSKHNCYACNLMLILQQTLNTNKVIRAVYQLPSIN